jgi:hypothetical protein
MLKRTCAHEQVFEGRVMFYLAAAVSDFYVPWPELPEHKIQSGGGGLNLQLQQVPKCLGLLRNNWAPGAFYVSFKLETDEQLLLEKSKASINNYGVHCVVANELHTRTERCAPPALHIAVACCCSVVPFSRLNALCTLCDGASAAGCIWCQALGHLGVSKTGRCFCSRGTRTCTSKRNL